MVGSNGPPANLRRPVRCAKCGGFLCNVEVLLYPTPIGSMLKASDLLCKKCGWKNEFTVIVEQRGEEK